MARRRRGMSSSSGGARSGPARRRVKRRVSRSPSSRGQRRSPPRRRQRRSPSRRRPRRSRSRSRSRSGYGPDRRPLIEREKGGVKLFIGRLPREANNRMLRECFEEFGEVLEVFVIDSQAVSNMGCAFIRMATLEQAEAAIGNLHEQRVLVPDQRDLGPMQVAFAKGEAVRLGIDEKEEILPSFKEARMKVVEQNEKRQFFEGMRTQQQEQQKSMEEQHGVMTRCARAMTLSTDALLDIIKDGQRFGGQLFNQKWCSYCDQGWGGLYDYDPNAHAHETLAQFITLAAYDHGKDAWFMKPFEHLPVPPMQMVPPGALPAGFAGPPPGAMPPFGPPGMGPPPAIGPPPGMCPPPFGPPGGPPPFGPPGRPPPSGAPRFLPPSGAPVGGMPGDRKLQDYADVDKLSDSDVEAEANIDDINVDDI